jgi:hypothetical protein
MKRKSILKVLILFASVELLTVFLLNYRYPFFTQSSEGWSVGYSSSKDFNFSIPIDRNKIIHNSDVTGEDYDSRFIADPFFIDKNDTTYVFVENQVKESNANISLFTLFESEIEYRGTIIDEDFHMSYPQVFQHEDEYYMLPETKLSDNVILYKAKNFPNEWVQYDTLISNVRYKDPTLLISDKGNYIFTCDDDMNLIIYEADSLFGDWSKKENIPILQGNKVRGGGRIFEYNNDYYYPVQNSQYGYGSGISLLKVTFDENNAIHLSEAKNWLLRPEKDIEEFSHGMHHLDIQKTKDGFRYVYDGDKNGDENLFNWKRTLKYNFLDLRNFWLRIF